MQVGVENLLMKRSKYTWTPRMRREYIAKAVQDLVKTMSTLFEEEVNAPINDSRSFTTVTTVSASRSRSLYTRHNCLYQTGFRRSDSRERPRGPRDGPGFEPARASSGFRTAGSSSQDAVLIARAFRRADDDEDGGL